MSTMWKLEEATGRMPRRKSQSDWDDGVEEVLSKKTKPHVKFESMLTSDCVLEEGWNDKIPT